MEKIITKNIEARTGRLFGDLWHKLDDEQFEQSVALFARRFEANGFDLSWLKGKRCLDAGCGGGRYSIAMARLGAREVIGVDVSEQGIENARLRGRDLSNLRFKVASVLELPFEDDSFDFVCSSGVLHHTTDSDRGLDQVARVLSPWGKLYLLLYGTGGLRWSLSHALRPITQGLGYEFIDAALSHAGCSGSDRGNLLDDFFVPVLELVEWKVLKEKLEDRGFTDINRWEKGRFDHESSPESLLQDLQRAVVIFTSAVEISKDSDARVKALALDGLKAGQNHCQRVEEYLAAFANGEISKQALDEKVIGEGHHRVLAVRGGV
jgi:ubiquinone/menaquinone biosynthesis C-methylase UbiE